MGTTDGGVCSTTLTVNDGVSAGEVLLWHGESRLLGFLQYLPFPFWSYRATPVFTCVHGFLSIPAPVSKLSFCEP